MLRLKLDEEGAVKLERISTSGRVNKRREGDFTSVSASKKTSERLVRTSPCDLTHDDLLNEIMDKIMELYMELAEDDEEAKEKIDERRLQSMKAFSEE